MSLEPPPFQEASRCDVCKCSFNTFRRRHHCRCCGRTLCAEHSSSQMALPQFGLHSFVRVCSDCFNDASRSRKDDSPGSLDGVNYVTDSVSRLDINTVAEPETKPITEQLGVSECKCGMPLCICEAPAPAPAPAPALALAPAQSRDSWTTSTSTLQSNPKPKKLDTKPRSRGSTSNSKHSLGPASNNILESNTDYEVNGEGLREAIKNGDTAAVRKLLSEGVDANYRDKQGLSLLHLAAVFNQTDISFILMDHGASLECKNSQGETPLDCAPVTLQYKMKKKLEEGL